MLETGLIAADRIETVRSDVHEVIMHSLKTEERLRDYFKPYEDSQVRNVNEKLCRMNLKRRSIASAARWSYRTTSPLGREKRAQFPIAGFVFLFLMPLISDSGH